MKSFPIPTPHCGQRGPKSSVPPSQTPFAEAPAGPVAYLERVQVAESTQEGWPGGAGQLLAERAGEVGYVAGGQHQHIQLGELGVRGHGRQSSLQGQEGLPQCPDPAPLPRRVLRTGLALHRGPPVSESDPTPIRLWLLRACWCQVFCQSGSTLNSRDREHRPLCPFWALLRLTAEETECGPCPGSDGTGWQSSAQNLLL